MFVNLKFLTMYCERLREAWATQKIVNTARIAAYKFTWIQIDGQYVLIGRSGSVSNDLCL